MEKKIVLVTPGYIQVFAEERGVAEYQRCEKMPKALFYVDSVEPYRMEGNNLPEDLPLMKKVYSSLFDKEEEKLSKEKIDGFRRSKLVKEILVVEDMQHKFNDIRKVIKALPSDFKYKITRESCSQRGERVLHEKDFDCAILDMNMPRYEGESATDTFGGIKIARRLRMRLFRKDLPTVVVSSEDQSEKLKESNMEDIQSIEYDRGSDWSEELTKFLVDSLLPKQN